MRPLVPALLVLFAACELSEVSIAEPEDVVVIEVILRTGVNDQQALVHRSTGLGLPPAVTITVTDGAGATYAFPPAPAAECLTEEEGADDVRCYEAANFQVRPGERFTLRAVTDDGRVLTGQTAVPGRFDVLRPDVDRCLIPAGTTYEVVWTPAENAWVYIVETRIAGLGPPFEEAGIPLPEDPLRLVGLAISREDTTIVFPSEFGLFDRFDDELSEALVALQGGLPAGASAGLFIGAADRNYVNWVRGGNFNPSGTVRVPSVFGEGGTGVFGSVVQTLEVIGVAPLEGPDCAT